MRKSLMIDMTKLAGGCRPKIHVLGNAAYHGNLQVTGQRVSGIRAPNGGVARGVRGLFRQAHSA